MATVTIRTLARQAGVSPATVSLALHGDARVASATRQTIRALAEREGYVPNRLARALQSGRSQLLGVLLPTVTPLFFSDILQDLAEHAARHDYGVLLGVTARDVEQETRQLAVFQEKRVEGIVAFRWHGASLARLLAFHRSGTPVSVCYWGSPAPDLPCAEVDWADLGRQAVSYLAELGHRRLAFHLGSQPGAASWQTHRPVAARVAAMRQALAERGLPPLAVLETADELAAALRAPDRPTGLVCHSDSHAIAALHAAQAAGLRVPDQLSVLGCSDVWLAELPEFRLTTFQLPIRQLGPAAMAALLAALRGEPARQTYLPARLIVRATTGAAPASP